MIARSSRIALAVARYASSSTRPLSCSRFAKSSASAAPGRDVLSLREAFGMLLEALDAEQFRANRFVCFRREPAAAPLNARRIKFFTTAFEIGEAANIQPEKSQPDSVRRAFH